MNKLISLFAFVLFFASTLRAQTTADINQQPLNFDNPSFLTQPGSSDDDDDDDDDDDESSSSGVQEGTVILYENVYEADGASYDAVVSFVSIDGGSCTDYDNTSSTQNNIPRWFSPRFYWNSGGGQAVIEVAFIEGGTVNNPTSVTFQEFLLNSYDLDGGQIASGAAGQYTDLQFFEAYTLGQNSTLNVTEEGGFTRFQSAQNQSTDAEDDETRLFSRFANVSTMTLRLGASGSGLAYYFIDFSEGLEWQQNPEPPVDNPEEPVVVAFNPTSACPGEVVTASGEGFSAVDAIKVNGMALTDYVILSDTTLTFTLPEGLGAGPASVVLCNLDLDYTFEGLTIPASDALGVCDGSCAEDADADGICDEDDPCVGDVDACGVCAGSGPTTWYADVDGDGLGDCASSTLGCLAPEGYVEDCGDACPNNPAKTQPLECGCDKVEFFVHGDVVCAELTCPSGDCPGLPELCGAGTVWDPSCQQCICAGPSCYGDLNDDGIIQLQDLLGMLGVYGTECPE